MSRVPPLAFVWTYADITGAQAEFDAYLRMVLAGNPAAEGSLPARALWKSRDLLGKWFKIGEIHGPAGSIADSVAARLPDDLRGTAAGLSFQNLPFVPIYRTSSEFAAETANATVHAVMHITWVERLSGTSSYIQRWNARPPPNGTPASAAKYRGRRRRHGSIYIREHWLAL